MTTDGRIEVCAHWEGLSDPTPMGHLGTTRTRGKEIFSFDYHQPWLNSPHRAQLDPALGLYAGPQYPTADRPNFGLFLDSSPDRWGRVLMRRREALLARKQGRKERRLLESDYLLGVHDGHRMGALRFRLSPADHAPPPGPFLDDNDDLAAPPWTSLRELEHAAGQLERDDAESDRDYERWLRMLISPGGSLGGARPKASVIDEEGQLWIAKFPSRTDPDDIAAWESVVHSLAQRAGIMTPEAMLRRMGSESGHHTFLSRRFDRTPDGTRHHFASALTLLERQDGDDGSSDGASYLELVSLLIRQGAQTTADLEQLWRRIVFFICVSNTDDHLRNHGFLLTPEGWLLAPAYDMNPDPVGHGLTLNISETDNAQSLELARDVSPYFRLSPPRAGAIIDEVTYAVSHGWRRIATAHGIPALAQDRMGGAFRVAEHKS